MFYLELTIPLNIEFVFNYTRFIKQFNNSTTLKITTQKMLKLKIIFSAFIILALNALTVAQVKMGDNLTSLNPNSALEIESTNKGLLIPRVALILTTDASPLSAHVAGMNVYNTATAGDVTPGNYYNNGIKWIKVADEANTGATRYMSVETNSSTPQISSTTDVIVPGMSISPSQSGTYSVLFNGQYSTTGTNGGGTATTSFSTAQGCRDIDAIYTQLVNIPVTNTSHGAAFVDGETVTPGVYTFGGVINVAGTVTLNGGGNPNALFIIRAIGSAINTAAGTTIVLTNGASANNVFWIAGGAISLGASTVMKGTLLGYDGAVSGGHFATIVGRMFARAGAINFDTGTASLPSPSTSSYVNYGTLSTFVMFTCTGAVANTGASNATGDLGTNVGAISGWDSPSTVTGTIYPAGSSGSISSSTTAINTLASFSIYQNGLLLANSTRTSSSNNSQMSLQAIATVVAGQPIEVRCKIDVGPLTLGNRILTLINVR